MPDKLPQTGPLVSRDSSDHEILTELLRINRITLNYVRFFIVIATAALIVGIIALLTR